MNIIDYQPLYNDPNNYKVLLKQIIKKCVCSDKSKSKSKYTPYIKPLDIIIEKDNSIISDELVLKLINIYNDLVEKFVILYNKFMTVLNYIKHAGPALFDLDLSEILTIDIKDIKIKKTNNLLNTEKIDVNILQIIKIDDKIVLSEYLIKRIDIYKIKIDELLKLVNKLTSITFSLDL